MHALMALLDSRRTSDFKMLQRFHYPRELSQMVSEVEKLQEFEKCGESDVRLLRKKSRISSGMKKASVCVQNGFRLLEEMVRLT
ncbi:hypothetical protein Q1695_004730 [Nippostrongylus brasiliensis]|nr:hypothetical protein Q1695_004730 [Nippostrongylus brasiliensis]